MINTTGSSPSITNLLLASSNLEYEFQLSGWCKKFLIKVRDKKDIKISFSPNETDIKYMSLFNGSIWWEDLVVGPIVLYFKALEDNVVVEILQWYSRD